MKGEIKCDGGYGIEIIQAIGAVGVGIIVGVGSNENGEAWRIPTEENRRWFESMTSFSKRHFAHN